MLFRVISSSPSSDPVVLYIHTSLLYTEYTVIPHNNPTLSNLVLIQKARLLYKPKDKKSIIYLCQPLCYYPIN